ncbi:nucleoid-associated protein YgaU [Roseibium hamelinense]|uniref:Nucleoid-associated protein YgaU n=1 Tax=Roseibium hamelinense TaxID=150831 RepID=A0A562T7Y5_9HYPH|nr:LysM peptidoglycan-binding domain-containing protein [Roseibium hamelinense]TWI89682.1 nucleoid-associated protein YgaU [Roseibium hamelinense]
MNRQVLAWTLGAGFVVAIAALITAGVFERGDGSALREQQAAAPSGQTQEAGGSQAAPEASGNETAGSAQEQTTETAELPATKEDPADEASDALKFDVVGVEPTGETVVAGQSDAGAIVALTANGEVVGKTIANARGEWTIVLEQPLQPGDYDVGLAAQEEDGSVKAESKQRVAVSIPEGGKDQPLVVLNTPDAPSSILQMPASSQAADAGTATPADRDTAETQTAEAPADAGVAPEVSGTAPASEDQTVVAEAVPTAPTPDTGTAAQGGAEQTQTARVSETDRAGAGTGAGQDDAGFAAAQDTNTPNANMSDANVQEAGGENSAAVEAASAPQEQEDQQAAAIRQTEAAAPAEDQTAQAAETAAQAPAPGAQETTVSAAGTGTDASATQGAQQASSTEAEPAVSETQSAALAPQSVPDQTLSQDVARDAAQVAEPAQDAVAPKDTPSVSVEAVETEKGKVFVAGTGEPGASVNVYVGDEFAGQAEVTDGGRWLVEGEKDLEAGDVEVRADLVETGTDEVEARAAVTFEKEDEQQIVLTKVAASGDHATGGGHTGSVNKPLPVVIIRKGDNLWRISRRLYGEGIRYTTIYQANQNQIRDPDLIYPGQIFLTPEGDRNWDGAAN